MKKLLLVFVTVVATIACTFSANGAAYYVTGDFNGWPGTLAGGAAMTETPASSGIWVVSLTGLTVGRHEFKVASDTCGYCYPGSGNSWLVTDGSGNITITFNANTSSDGWHGAFGRIGLNVDPGTWTAVGDWEGWNNANPNTVMASLGSGIYSFTTNLPPGTWQIKAVKSGSWDSIGNDFRSINGDNWVFTNTTAGPVAYTISVNALVGDILLTNPAPACTYSLSPTTAFYSSTGGSGSVTLTTGGSCAWAATSNVPWVTITSATSGTGSSSINYSIVGTNTNTSGRSGTITIAGQTFSVYQYSPLLGGVAIDGTAETNVYGCVPLAVQAIGTDVSNSTTGQVDVANGNELDAGYGRVENGVLYLVLAGNLSFDGTRLNIFFDTGAPGGQNTLTNVNPGVDFNMLNRLGATGNGAFTNPASAGLTFDAGFAANYWVDARLATSPFTLYACYAQLFPGGGGTNGYYLGQTVGLTNGTLFTGTNPFGIQVAVNNLNVGGVDGNACYEDPVDYHQDSVKTGVELAIPLAALGNPTGAVKVCAFFGGINNDYMGNQTLGPIWDGSGFYCTNNLHLIDTSLINLSTLPGKHYFLVGPGVQTKSIAKSGNDIQVTWLSGSNSNLIYQLERSYSITSPSWSAVGSPTNGTGSAITLTDPNAATNSPSLFYHVRETIAGCP